MESPPKRFPKFAKRLVTACDEHPECPPLHQGRQVWLKKRLAEDGLFVSTEAIRKWLAGEGRPRHESAEKLAKVLGVSAARLIMGRDVEPAELAASPAGSETPALPIMIRPGHIVEIRGLPIDLTRSEASKVANIVLAHALVD